MSVPPTVPIQFGAGNVVPTTALLGVGAAALVWGVRLAIRRRREHRRPENDEGPVALRTDGDGIGTARSAGSGTPDVALRIPVPLPGRTSWPVSHAELHAVELGFVGGALLAWFASLVVVDPIVGTLVGAAMGAFGIRRVRSMAAETVRQATLHCLGATVLGTAIGVVAFF